RFTPSHLTLLLILSSSLSTFTVTQPPTASMSPGGTVRLSCTLGGSYTVSNNRVVWIQQKQGNAPRFLLYFFTESSKGMGSWVPSWFSDSRSGSDKEGYLTISGALEEDDAVYYCVTWTGSACTMLQACREVGQEPPPPAPLRSLERVPDSAHRLLNLVLWMHHHH
uniref:Ig-like domain-containing protein n=1 Tax=Crocodylus porosus TaxID=8502 RepID=A0A7M4DZD8_CROPO